MYARLRLQLAVLMAKLCFLHFFKNKIIPAESDCRLTVRVVDLWVQPKRQKKFYELAVFLVDRRLQI